MKYDVDSRKIFMKNIVLLKGTSKYSSSNRKLEKEMIQLSSSTMKNKVIGLMV